MNDTSKFLVRLMMDSGAYSAWRQRKRIDLASYITYCLANQEYLDSFRSGSTAERRSVRASLRIFI
jgi:hypothetical protein